MKSVRTRLAVGLILALVLSPAARADQTITQPIAKILYNGVADYRYFVGPARWTASGCNPFYIEVTGTLPGRDRLLSIAMMAYAAGKRVTFSGDCNTSNSDYFTANYITVED